ncbi:MAG: hypothetical protein ACYDBJ_18925 [Aggregatilineales bacterium]
MSKDGIVYLNRKKDRFQSSSAESGGIKRTMMLCTMAELQHQREQGVLIKALMTDYRLSKSSNYRDLDQVA